VPVGIDDVAALAGVSTATVSRALRGLPNVATATRARVLDAAHALDYVSSPSASRLASGRTFTVGAVTPFLGRWFFGQVLSGVEGVLRENGYDLLLYALPDDESRSRFFGALPLRRRVDAVLVLTMPLSQDEVESLWALDVPIVFVGTHVPDGASVLIDDLEGARRATRYLIELGHRRIAMIGENRDEPIHFTAPTARREGYRRALVEAGIRPDRSLEVEGYFTVDGGGRAMAELLQLPDPPTAVFAQSDEMAYGAVREAHRAGLHVPDDLSIIGFDDHELASMLGISTMAQQVPLQGRLAARLVLDALEEGVMGNRGQGPRQGHVVPTELVVRESTAPPRRS
jgi:DNA-binding LacI/PurR family transcriptional regulator